MKVYFVSLGPNDPNLITLQSKDILLQSDYIFTPIAIAPSGKKTSKAIDILKTLGIGDDTIVSYELPMNKDRNMALTAYHEVAKCILDMKYKCPEKRISVVAEGDGGFFSSSQYIAELIKDDDIEIIQTAGVPAFIACNALQTGQLVQLEEKLIVIPGIASQQEWDYHFQSNDTIVVMKCSQSESYLKNAIKIYNDRIWSYFEYVGTNKEYFSMNIDEIVERKFPYFSIIISRPQRKS